MKLVLQEKPPLLSLFHSGVKGMKWGVRKAKPTNSEIRAARKRQDLREDRITNADMKLNASGGRSKKYKDEAHKAAVDWETNEDRVTAARITTGEKFLHVALLGPLALVSIHGANAYARSVAKEVDSLREGMKKGTLK